MFTSLWGGPRKNFSPHLKKFVEHAGLCFDTTVRRTDWQTSSRYQLLPHSSCSPMHSDFRLVILNLLPTVSNQLLCLKQRQTIVLFSAILTLPYLPL
mmetsp:Transcript_19891/g.48832  ORF Transcript_19891/g.48832 Transcript_19891/m.48832 type:complete len:97 (-) Transcript_19891:1080-1370(-)